MGLKMFRKKTKTEEPFVATLGGVIPDGKLDITSATWVTVSNYCNKRIADLRETNDNINLKETQTAVIRGQIRELKNILDLPKPKPEMYINEEI